MFKFILLFIFIFIVVSDCLGEDSLFAPTPVDVIIEALSQANIKQADIVYDIGCGDARVCVIASKMFGCKSVGIDIDKAVVDIAKKNVKLNKLENLVNISYGDALKVDLSKATVVFMYLQPELSNKVVKRLSTGTVIIAHDKPISELKPQKTLEILSKDDKKTHKIYFYKK